MTKKRIHRKSQRSADDVAREKAVREKFQSEKPTIEELVASGEYVGPMTQQQYWDLSSTLSALKAARAHARLSLADLSETTGMDRAAISRLENGVAENPTINTVQRYAQALGKRIVFTIQDAE